QRRSRCDIRADANRVGSLAIPARRWRWSTTRTNGNGTNPARAQAAVRVSRTPPRSDGAPSGVRPAADHGAGDRASTHQPPLSVWDNHLWHSAGRRDRTGAVRDYPWAPTEVIES